MFKKDIERAARLIYNGRLKGKSDTKMARKVATVLSQAILKGYGSGFPIISFNTPDHEMYRNLEKQVYQFSFAKTYEQLKATTLALKTGDQITSWPEFRDIASRINNDFNARYLRPEYDTAIGSAQMASKWVQFIQDAVEMLVYMTVGDSNVRPSHKLLDGITKAIADAFWSKYYPPNGFGCRCDAVEATTETETPADKIIYPTDVPKMFQTNLAANGLAFPDDHPYFEHVPDDILEAADQSNPFLYEKEFEGKKDGSVWVNALTDANARDTNLAIAKPISNLGHQVILLPDVQNNSAAERALRKMVLPETVKPGKNPDAMIDKKLFEFKDTEGTKSAIQNAIDRGRKQASNLVISIPDKVSEAKFKQYAKGKLKQLKSDIPEEIWMIRKGKVHKYKADELIKKQKRNR